MSAAKDSSKNPKTKTGPKNYDASTQTQHQSTVGNEPSGIQAGDSVQLLSPLPLQIPDNSVPLSLGDGLRLRQPNVHDSDLSSPDSVRRHSGHSEEGSKTSDFSFLDSPTRSSKRSSMSSMRWSPKSSRSKVRPVVISPITAESVFYDSFLQHELSGRPLHQRKRSWFVIGVLLGVVIAMFCLGANTHHRKYLEKLGDYVKFTLADVDLSALLPGNLSVDEIFSNLTRLLDKSEGLPTEGDFLPGLQLVASENLTAHFPVVLIPGTISTGLESWGTSECSKPYFRQRMWGTLTMFRAVLLDKACWTEHLLLDDETGLDPPGIKLRAALGLDAADYFVSGYWVWGKIIENLATLGYDSNNLHLAAYDWRLAYGDLERRDHYFTKLKSTLELHKRQHGRRNIIVAHSMGANVFLYFMHWVESTLGGQGGRQWVEEHVETMVSIGGPMLGVTKTLSSLLSGEQRETVQPLGAYVLEQFFNKQERATLFRSWGGLASLLPRGGNHIWGNMTWAPDDDFPADRVTVEENLDTHLTEDQIPPPSLGQVLLFPSDNPSGLTNATMDDALMLLNRSTSTNFRRRVYSEYSFGVETDPIVLSANSQDRPATWANPLESQLPNAPSTKIYCLYGVGKGTERGYYYTDEAVHRSTAYPFPGKGEAAEAVQVPVDPEDNAQHPTAPLVYIDVSMSGLTKDTDTGIRIGDGDGTVPLLSLGYMCVNGWQQDRYNPAQMPIITREYRHNPTHIIKGLRGGRETADHVDILGNYQLTVDLLRIVANKADHVGERIFSPIKRYAENIDLDKTVEK
ncbi:phospholipid:diacylglycerol acyltransferase [Dispira simplex]|nr:phospholipid:diacylglycerol acyltransferase [Dispira simplex]